MADDRLAELLAKISTELQAIPPAGADKKALLLWLAERSAKFTTLWLDELNAQLFEELAS